MHFIRTIKKAGNFVAWSLVSLSFTGCLATSIPNHSSEAFYDELDRDYCAQCEQHSQAVQPWLSGDEGYDLATGIDPAYTATDECEYGPGLPLPLPAIPIPSCLSRWHNKESLPEAPPYPRFHPLPTRPIFSPAIMGDSERQAHLNQGS